MTERKEDIRRLLDRYMAGDTTLEEEARLADYFRSPGADKEFAAFRNMFSLFNQGEPSFPEQEMDKWIEDVQSPKSAPHRDKRLPAATPLRRTARFAIGLAAAASIAAVSFYLGTRAPEHRASTQTPAPPEIQTVTLTQVKWHTDTVYIEKTIVIRPSVAASSPTSDSLRHDLATNPQAEMAFRHPADSTTDNATEMPHLVDIQAEFDKQRKRMEEITEQYELIAPPYENIY